MQQQLLNSYSYPSSTRPPEVQPTYMQQTLGPFTNSSQLINPSNILSSSVAPLAIEQSNFTVPARLPPVPVAHTRTHALPSPRPRFTPQCSNPPASTHLPTPMLLEDSRQAETEPPAPANTLLPPQIDSSLSRQTTAQPLSADACLPQLISHSQTLSKSMRNQSGLAGDGNTIGQSNDSMESASHNYRFSHPPIPVPPSTYSPEVSNVVHSRSGMEDIDVIIVSLLSGSKDQSSTLTTLANNPEDLHRVIFGLLSDATFVDMVR
jgi:hypothetical protein